MSGPTWISPTLPVAQVANMCATGDSITACSTYCTTTQRWPYLLGQLAGAAYGSTCTNDGVSGNSIADMVTRQAATDAFYNGAMQQNHLFLMAGTNILGTAPAAPASLSQLQKYIAARVATGWMVHVFTLADFNPYSPTFNPARHIYNPQIKSQFLALGAVGVIDLGGSAEMGVDGPGLSANFGADLGHPSPAGAIVIANYAYAELKRTARFLH